jgi:hypothetical protein
MNIQDNIIFEEQSQDPTFLKEKADFIARSEASFREVIFQNHIILFKGQKATWYVPFRAKVFCCKKHSGPADTYPCDYHGIDMNLKVTQVSDSRVLFNAPISGQFFRLFNADVIVEVSVDDSRVGSDGAAMYIHLEKQE